MNSSIPANEMTARGDVGRGPSQTNLLSSGQRWLSLAEFVLGTVIVIGHNVYHVVPNEVPILFVLGLISFRLRDGGWLAMGLQWPTSWRRTVLIALAAAALRILLGALTSHRSRHRPFLAAADCAERCERDCRARDGGFALAAPGVDFCSIR
jgi:hypothetical protein